MAGKEIHTIRDALAWARVKLTGAGVPDAQRSAEVLLGHILELKRHELFMSPDRRLTNDELGLFFEFVGRRADREPLQYIIGEEEFWGLTIKVTRDTLIPRPETEILVGEALRLSKEINLLGGRLIIIDLCTGSGCMAVAVAKELPECRVYATDISEAALSVARGNAFAHGVQDRVEFLKGDLYEPLTQLNLRGRAAMILSNPPYVSKSEMKDLQPEIISYEPGAALYGGEDGLDFYRRIVKGAPLYLSPGGYLILEIGYGKAGELKEMVLKAGRFEEIEIKEDLSGVERVLTAKKTKDR